jgi:AbrB family looped-hinge helix DNA binding protein
MRITSKGQVTIPADIREKAGLLPHTEVDFEFDGTAVLLVRAQTAKKATRGARVVAHLRNRGDVAMSTDAIMALTRSE